MSYYSYKLPKIPPPKVVSVGYGEVSSNIGYDEVIYNYNTMTYETLSQKKQVEALEKQLSEKKEERVKNLKSIVGYFYKRNY